MFINELLLQPNLTMHTLIHIQMPEQYSYAPERAALPITPPFLTYADVDVPEALDVPEDAVEPAEVVFRSVVSPTAALRSATISGSVRVIYNGGVYAVTLAEHEANDNVYTLTATYQAAYEPPAVDAVTIGGVPATAGDDEVVVQR